MGAGGVGGSLPAPTPAPTPGATPAPRGRRPSPRIAQLKRTWYFLSRNTLALIGLGILIFFIGVALSQLVPSAHPLPRDSLQQFCGTYTGLGGGNFTQLSSGECTVVCTYASNQPPPSPNCYAVDQFNPANVPPTFNIAHLAGGPLPLGSLTISSNGNLFYSIYDGFIVGAQWSLFIAVTIVVSGALIGLALGAVAGYLGGLVDELIMRITDIFLSIPGLLLVLVILAAIGHTFSTLEGRVGLLVGAFVITWWPSYTRVVRGQVLVTREQKYVEASRASGAKTGRIIVHHIVPNSVYPVLVQLSLDVGAIPLLIGGITFLGYQIFPTVYFPEWGTMSALAINILPSALTACQISSGAAPCMFPWWQLLFPGLIVFLFAISVNFLSDGMRDAFDPRLRR
ncbi:MAG TPA: ABC transporter permease [Thermoplasmata archaeon]|jgi:peptide/nickel transport system permease protein|nr:ABC transporter permease [Thermoplasmata archaeon]